MNDRITLVAHRGIHQAHPENSLEAFGQAWQQGIEWCECDVRGSSEDEPFILHDETLDRTTSGHGLIAQTPAAMLNKLHLRRADGEISASALPSLASIVDAMPPAGRLLIEIKPKVAEAVVRRTLDLCDERSCIVQSFDRGILATAARIRPEIRRVLLVDDPAAISMMQHGPWEGINSRHDRLLPEQVQQMREMGLSVGVWTPNEPAALRRAIGLGVDTIISDQPLRAAELLRALLTLKSNPGA